MKFYADRMRHLVCVPFSVANLHEMARQLGIKRCWYHASKGHPHYDIPKRRVEQILTDPRVEVVSGRTILAIMKGQYVTGIDIDSLAARTLETCRLKGWERTWQEGGACLHLEASEFIEAFRGKKIGMDPILATKVEAGDVLFVLFSMLAAKGIKPSEVLPVLRRKCELVLQPTFVERAVAGEFDDLDEAFDDAVGAWHAEPLANNLIQWLGLTEEEYRTLMETPGALSTIIDRYRAGSH